MRKVLLIEDRAERQKDLLKSSDVNLKKHSDILDNMIEDKFENFIKDIKNNNFDLTSYDVIIAHQSIFIEDKRELLSIIKNSCKEGKKLVLFSGDMEISSYSNVEYEELVLSSKKLYSKNLELFLKEFEEGKINIRILTFGIYWKINIMLNVLEKINLFIEETSLDKKILYPKFLNEVDFHLMNDFLLNLYPITDRWVELSQIIKLRDSLKTTIEELADE